MQQISIPGHAMTYVEAGAGAPLLLVHGSLNDHRYWAPQIDAFAAAGFRTIAPSLRHCWPEAWDGQGDGFRLDQHIADIAAFIAALGAGPVHLLGHSRGGYIAFRLAERHPQLVRRLVLAEPAGVLGEGLLPPGTAPASYTALIADAVDRVRDGDTETGLRLFYTYAVGPEGWDRLPEDRRQICRDNAATLLGQSREGREPYGLASARAIAAPTLLVGGTETRPVFAAVLAGLARGITTAATATIPGGTHLLNWDNPAAFNAAVLAFLTGQPG